MHKYLIFCTGIDVEFSFLLILALDEDDEIACVLHGP